MLPESLSNLIGLIYNYCYHLYVFPFYWNYKKGYLILSKSKFRLFISINSFALNIIHVLIVLEKFILMALNKLPYDPMILFLMFVFLIVVSIPMTIAGGIYLQLEDIVCCINQYYAFYRRIEGK